MMMKFSGVDGAQDLVLQFMDMIDARGQYDLLAGAKVSYDADAVLVPTGVNQAILCGPWQRENEDPPKFPPFGQQKIDLLHPLVVYLAEDLLPQEGLVREVIVAMKDFTGQQRVKAGLSQMVGSPTLALL